jgi:hypothetical protein
MPTLLDTQRMNRLRGDSVGGEGGVGMTNKLHSCNTMYWIRSIYNILVCVLPAKALEKRQLRRIFLRLSEGVSNAVPPPLLHIFSRSVLRLGDCR